jgi:hypothetical protein
MDIPKMMAPIKSLNFLKAHSQAKMAPDNVSEMFCTWT